MGCDIHLYVERKVDGKWVSADMWKPDPDTDEEEGGPRMIVERADRFYKGRNYDLFGMLANVRNGRGFAGCVTGTGFEPISMPKGLPEDVSPEVKAESDCWNGDGHSHSWLTLAELKAYDWEGKKTEHLGHVDIVNFAVFERQGTPGSYSGGVTGQRVKYVSHDEMRALVEEHKALIEGLIAQSEGGVAWPTYHEQLYKMDLDIYHTIIKWEEVYAGAAGHFVTETIPKLESLSYGNPENVRIVFFFDN